MRLGPEVEGHFGEVGGQEAGVEDGGEALDGAGAVFVLAAGERGEEFGERVRRGGRSVGVGEGRGSQT